MMAARYVVVPREAQVVWSRTPVTRYHVIDRRDGRQACSPDWREGEARQTAAALNQMHEAACKRREYEALVEQERLEWQQYREVG